MTKMEEMMSMNSQLQEKKPAAPGPVKTGRFVGVGVGPGPSGYITVAALSELKAADAVLMPRSKDSSTSLARQCLAGLDIADDKFEEIVYGMETEVNSLRGHYDDLARRMAARLKQGENLAYLTLGDALTYSTYGYALRSLLELIPDLEHKTYPGVTSFASVAAAVGFPLGQMKERTLILPCPEDKAALVADIRSHDIVVLMKIGRRLPMVLEVLQELGIASHCAMASRLGLPGETVVPDLSVLELDKQETSPQDYFTTMLIRKDTPPFARANSVDSQSNREEKI